jgi:hypothetical protein
MEILNDYLSEKGRKFSISSFFKDKTREIERFNDTLNIKNEWEELKNEWDTIVEDFVDEHPEVTVIFLML